MFSQYFNKYRSINVCSMEESVFLTGRPHGGCTILYRDDLNCKTIYIEHSKRVCGVTYELNKSSI